MPGSEMRSVLTPAESRQWAARREFLSSTYLVPNGRGVVTGLVLDKEGYAPTGIHVATEGLPPEYRGMEIPLLEGAGGTWMTAFPLSGGRVRDLHGRDVTPLANHLARDVRVETAHDYPTARQAIRRSARDFLAN